MMTTTEEWIVSVSIILGTFLVFLAAVGIFRMPDIYARCHTSSKASTLGKIFPFMAVAIFFGELGIYLQSGLVILFFFITAPVGTHLIARAAYKKGSQIYDKTRVDEYKSSL